jgi:streptogramin lyase
LRRLRFRVLLHDVLAVRRRLRAGRRRVMGSFLWKRSQAEAAVTVSGQTAAFNTSTVGRAALDINIKSINAGNITFVVERLGADGIWYAGATTAALTAAGNTSIEITDALADGADAQHMVFADQARVRWTLAGGANSVVFSGSFYGRE